MTKTLELTIQRQGRDPEAVSFAAAQAVIAGWTGRDPVAVEKHIAELEQLGVKRPASTPIYYRVSANRLTTDSAIEVSGDASSGEVEFVLFAHGGALFVGVGSDHTDRQVETYNVTVSKQMCCKPLAGAVWPMSEVAGHWDQLVLRSHIIEDGKRVLYQEGQVSGMLQPDVLVGKYAGDAAKLADGTVMFCGTFAAKGGIRPSARFEYELEDPVLGRKISSAYDMTELPVVG
ncbi:MAG: DUF2848 domain-containing protein [Hyphomicrobiales bacterium]|nr:DUF2848 domain-containing protein [Hyphomicrobiales bacterium]